MEIPKLNESWFGSDAAGMKSYSLPTETVSGGVPAMVGAKMMLTGKWRGKGVFNIEQLDPDPFLDELAKRGLPWHVNEM